METDLSQLRKCIDCKSIISKNAETCPQCGSKKPGGETFGSWIISALILGFMLFDIGMPWWGTLCIALSIIFAIAQWGIWKSTQYNPTDNDSDLNRHDKDKERSFPLNKKNTYPAQWKEKYWETIQDTPVDASLHIDYCDANGEQSERVIRISQYDGSCYLPAFCELRNDYRTFRIDRILQAVDANTGEVIKDVPSYLLAKYKSSPEYKLNLVLKKGVDIIKILYYVSKADGQLRKEELHIIGNVIRKIAKDDRLTDIMIKKELNKMPVPSPQAFKLAVNRLSKKNLKNLIVTRKIAENIIGTQKTVHPLEEEALTFISKKIKSIRAND